MKYYTCGFFVHFIQGFIDETFIFEKSIQGAEKSIYCSKRHCLYKRQNITYNLGLLQLSKATTVKFGLLKSAASETLLQIKAS